MAQYFQETAVKVTPQFWVLSVWDGPQTTANHSAYELNCMLHDCLCRISGMSALALFFTVFRMQAFEIFGNFPK